MYNLLNGLTVVEASSFVAAPLAGLYLSQLGANVIRVDQIGGGPDFHRWPVNKTGQSLFWEGLNKGKKSLAVDLKSARGRDLLVRLATSSGPRGGILLTNFPSDGFLAHDALKAKRRDQITVRIMGWPDGTNAVDYTINPAVGMANMTEPSNSTAPTNHVLPAWDLLTGSMAAISLISAERHRLETGTGGEIRIPLSDVAFSTLANLGILGEVITSGKERARYGNDLYGAFGRDFETKDDRRVMIVALTPRQWTALIAALNLQQAIADLELTLRVDFTTDEGNRFRHRERINPLVADAVKRYPLAELSARLDQYGVCWDTYKSVLEAYESTPQFGKDNPIFSELLHPSGERYPAPGFAGTFREFEREDARPAPRLGADTELVLTEILNFSSREVRGLHDAGVVASSKQG